jgi:sugar phosphate isomerase/epimerase
MDSLVTTVSRRAVLAAAAAPLVGAAKRKISNGLELYSVRDELKKDLMGTVRAVAKMGYENVEFFSPYYDWTVSYAKEVRKLLDDLGVKCLSTHNSGQTFTPERLPKAIELNQALGCRYVVQASAGRVTNLDGWKGVAENLARSAETLKSAGLRAGYHNHAVEFKALEGKMPMEVLAANTPADVMLQLDVGTCVEMKVDPVAWIKSNPGRIRSLHLKDWSEAEGFKVLLGEGSSPWKKILAAAEKTGGAEFYLVEQEGSRFTPLETAEMCLKTLRKLRS